MVLADPATWAITTRQEVSAAVAQVIAAVLAAGRVAHEGCTRADGNALAACAGQAGVAVAARQAAAATVADAATVLAHPASAVDRLAAWAAFA